MIITYYRSVLQSLLFKNFVNILFLSGFLQHLHLKNLPKGDIIVVSESSAKIGVFEMKHEKSCGGLIYREHEGETHILLLKHRCGGHWSFPKGHMEAGETEMETALREIREETGLRVFLREGFREAVEYSPKPNVKKQVIYFIGFTLNESTLHPQEEEVSELQWMEIHAAYEAVTFRNDKNLIAKAMDFIDRRGM